MFFLLFILAVCNAEKFVVTGCAGYIGSHMSLELLEQGHTVIGVDNLSRGSNKALDFLETYDTFTFYNMDLGDSTALRYLFYSNTNIDTVIHFAAVAFARESVEYPQLYKSNITTNTQHVVDTMIEHGIQNLVYSSTCAVYGAPKSFPITEKTPTNPVSPYGKYKLEAEKYIQSKLSKTFRAHILRYFNVVGADPQNRLGENPKPSLSKYGRLWTSVVDTIFKKKKCVSLYESTLDTPDGTAVRDYVHVTDLVKAHLAVLDVPKSDIWNVATGQGVSTLEFIKSAERVSNVFIPICFGKNKLSYSPPFLQASNQKITSNTNWKPQFTNIDDILSTAWNWASKNNQMKTEYDVCIAGAGLSAAVLAERHSNIYNHSVLIMEKRNHIGGNCYDYIDEETGIRVSQYGVHLFHTKYKQVWEYIQQFSEWTPWEHTCVAKVGEQHVPVPVNIDTVNALFNMSIQNEEEMSQWLSNVQIPFEHPQNSEEVGLSRVGQQLYDLIFKPYTIKQWNKEPSQLAPSVLARIPVRKNNDNRYFTDEWQALPTHGYTRIFENMFRSKNITVLLNSDYFKMRSKIKCGHTYFTGPIDAYFAAKGMKKLEYRSLNFERKVFKNTTFFQPKAHVNYPSLEYNYTRAIEYKHILHQKSPHTVVFFERSTDVGEPYYPVPNPENQALYAKYQALAEQEQGVTFVGRLANYKYFNMDQTILNALQLFGNVCKLN